MKIMQIQVALYSHYINICVASYLSLFSQVIHLFLNLNGYGKTKPYSYGAICLKFSLECLLHQPWVLIVSMVYDAAHHVYHFTGTAAEKALQF